MKIKVLAIGKIKQKYFEEGIKDYVLRINRFLKFTIEIIPDIKNKSNSNKSEIIKRESEKFLSKINPNNIVVLMDLRGKHFNSLTLSKFIEHKIIASPKNTLFVLGGSFGVSDELKIRADYIISLSELTFTHEMVQLILVEQIYRSLTIMKNIPYHH